VESIFAAHNPIVLNNERIVRLLLKRQDTNPNILGRNNGPTALWRAAEKGNERMVKWLLERGANPNTQYYGTPLSSAADRGHEGVLRALLKRSDVNPNIADPTGATPLWWAAYNGNEGVMSILLERNDLDPNIPDTLYHSSPLMMAAKTGGVRVVSRLLKRDDIDVNRVYSSRRETALLVAAEWGKEGVVRMLLKRKEIDPNIPNREGETPLLLAIHGIRRTSRPDEGIVRLLLERNDINLNIADTRYGQTPLEYAVSKGYQEIAELLQERANSITSNRGHVPATELVLPDISGPSERPRKRARRL